MPITFMKTGRGTLSGQRHPVRSQGFTLLEVLVAVVVLSVGLLGLAGLQATGLKNSHSAFLRGQAAVLSQDILDRMRANSGNWEDYLTVAPSTASVEGQDLSEWQNNIARLPGGSGTLSNDGNVVTVTVTWLDNRNVDNADIDSQLSVVTRARF